MTAREQFAAIFEAHRADVEAHIRRIVRDASIAEDLTQETFCRAWQHFGQFREQATVRTWLWTIAKNTAIDYLAQKQMQVEVQDYTVVDDFEEEQQHREILELLEAKIKALPLRSKIIFLLAQREEIKYSAISRLLAIPIGTIMSSTFHARKQLEND